MRIFFQFFFVLFFSGKSELMVVVDHGLHFDTVLVILYHFLDNFFFHSSSLKMSVQFAELGRRKGKNALSGSNNGLLLNYDTKAWIKIMYLDRYGEVRELDPFSPKFRPKVKFSHSTLSTQTSFTQIMNEYYTEKPITWKFTMNYHYLFSTLELLDLALHVTLSEGVCDEGVLWHFSEK